MRQHLLGLRGIPILALPGPSEALRTMRSPPRPGQLPTLLAIAEALALLEGEEIARPLRELFELAVERMTGLADARQHRYLRP
jgi:DTW domain-containing protein YfiP